MADIADMVGVRSPSLYYHFSDKSDVLRAIADVIMDDALSDSHKLVRSKSDTTTKRLHDLVGGIVYRLRTSPYELNCMFDPVFLTEEFRDVSKKIHSWAVDLESLIRQGVSEGCFAPQNSKMAMHTVRGLVQSAIRHPGGIPKLSPKEIADYFATFAVKGLLADTRR